MSTDALTSSLPNGAAIWASRILTILQTVAFPLAFWFRPVCITVAAFWLVYRAYQVLHIPLDDLASLLGFDIPLTPVLDLASIKADGCIIHWTLPEKQRQKSKFKYEILLNGQVVESVSVHESAVTITGLQPSSFYVARVALVYEAEIGSRSEPIRFRTKPASSGDFFVVRPDALETEHDGSAETLPHVHVYRGWKDIALASVEATPMAREGSNAGLGPKRSITGRRSSPAALGLDTSKVEPQIDEGEPPEGVETIQQLTEKLDMFRRETDEAERMARDEEDEESKQKDELTAERDTLRAEAAEKERATRNLKREVNTLERQNTAAQNERSKQERLLAQKKQEREKLQQDMGRWVKEAASMQEEVARIRLDKTGHLQRMDEEKEALRAKQNEEATSMKSLEDEIRETNSSIKRIDRAMKNNSPDGSQQEEPNLVQQMQQDAEDERQWQIHKASLQQQYAGVYQKLEAAKRFHGEQIRYLESLRAQRRREDDFAAAQQQQYSSPLPAAERPIHRGNSQRSRRAPSGQSNDSPRLSSFPMVASNSSQGAFATGLTTVSPASAFHPSPFFNPQNGMTLHTSSQPTDEVSMSDEDKDRMTGGALMSPGAGADLLPADLFSGDDKDQPGQQILLPGLGSLPGLGPSPLPAPLPTDLSREHPGPGPASPASFSSRSPSVFASPQASQHNLHLNSPDNAFASMDPDRRSIRSTRSSRAATGVGGTPAASSRFSSMFGIKPRTKTTGSASLDEGPALGKAQSHSMPRQDQGIPGLDAAARKRNSSISGVFGGPALEDLGTGPDKASDSLAGTTPSSAQASRRRAFMGSIFNRDKDAAAASSSSSSSAAAAAAAAGVSGFGGGWPSSFTAFGRRPGSPRPGSTHSNELPRPSVESSRWVVDPWPAGDAAAGARSSPLSFTAGWPAPAGSGGGAGASRLYGSRHPSRRPSVQYGASGPPEDILEDEDSDALDAGPGVGGGPHLAPIGTRPSGKKAVMGSESVQTTPQSQQQSQQQQGLQMQVPKLNPAAKDFKSFFGIKSSKDKGRSGSPAAAVAGSSNSTSNSAAGTPVPSSSLLASSFTSTPRGDFLPPDGYDDSPPDSRKSRSDARSMTTTESSFAESNELGYGNGLGSANDLARTPSYTNSDAMGPSPLIGSLGKESFMQKITRKSSSGKFGLPTFSKRGQSRLLDTSTVSSGTSGSGGPAEVEEEDSLSASVGSLRGSGEMREKDGKDGKEGQRGSGRSWSSVLKLGKGSVGARKGGETPSLSGLSLASGTETGTEDGEEEGEEER